MTTTPILPRYAISIARALRKGDRYHLAVATFPDPYEPFALYADLAAVEADCLAPLCGGEGRAQRATGWSPKPLPWLVALEHWRLVPATMRCQICESTITSRQATYEKEAI